MKKKGYSSDTYMEDMRLTVGEAVLAYYEKSGEDPMEAALKPEDYLIFVVSVIDEDPENDGYNNGIIEDVLPLDKAYSEGIAE
jgi:hypothetical protein